MLNSPPMNKQGNLADVMGMPVEYRGVTGTKQHMFSNGPTQMVNYVSNSLEDAVKRFGKRINVREREHHLALAFRDGVAAKSYSPNPLFKPSQLVEYGRGYVKRLISELHSEPIKELVVEAPKAPVSPEPEKKRRGRPPTPRNLSSFASKQAPGLPSSATAKLRASLGK